MERIFIENKIYRKIENEETWDGVARSNQEWYKAIYQNFKRNLTEEDITRLTEIKIKRISKFDIDKAKKELKV